MRRFLPAYCVCLILAAAAAHSVAAEKRAGPKYVFLFIGDGMANVQIHAAEAYLAALMAEDTLSGGPKVLRLRMTSLPVHGMCQTFANNRLITDSAASGTALACGRKTDVGVIAMAPGAKTALATLAEKAKASGKAVGILSSVSIDHATPACFYAHVPNRGMYHQICLQLAASDFDLFGGGGMIGRKSGGKDALLEAQKNGMVFADLRRDISAIESGRRAYISNRALGGNAALHYEIDRLWLQKHGDNEERDQLSLAGFTREAIRLLSTGGDGFFLMIEAGKIDWACHANDAKASIIDTIALDHAVSEAIDFQQKHPEETLLVVTGDHECGGMSMGFAGTNYETAFESLQHQKVSYEFFEKRPLAKYLADFEKANPGLRKRWDDTTMNTDAGVRGLIKEYFGFDFDEKDPKKHGWLSPLQAARIEAAFDRTMSKAGKRPGVAAEQDGLLYGGYDPLTVTLTHVMNQKAGIGFSSFVHTAVPVMVIAGGKGEEAFQGFYDNTDVAKKLAAAMGVKLD